MQRVDLASELDELFAKEESYFTK